MDKPASSSSSSSSMELVREEELLQSPSKARYADRFVPSRNGRTWHLDFPESPNINSDQTSDVSVSTPKSEPSSEGKTNPYSCLLKNEILGYDYDCASVSSTPTGKKVSRNLFHYDCMDRPLKSCNRNLFSPYASPISDSSQKLLRTPLRKRRRIAKVPYKILDAPSLADDYYLNLLDWSQQDIICIALGGTVYTWSASTSNVEVLYDLNETSDYPTSVRWNDKGNLVALGTASGTVRVWDLEASKVVFESQPHSQRIGSIEWNGSVLFTGSRDAKIKMIDFRGTSPAEILVGSHRQEVCGLRWSSINSCLASGGNDNNVFLWDLHSTQPALTMKHSAAVKALSWSPHDTRVLTTGGGTSDRCIKFWNIMTGTCIESINTESQVCNLAWSPHSKELVSTHGYANNNVAVWKYPSMTLVESLKGHTSRVLYMAMSPDGRSVCTGAADETLRFWRVFEPFHCKAKKSPLDLFKGIR